MLRILLLALAVAATASEAATANDSRYARANARLARATPHYPGARLLIEEPVNGQVGRTWFQAVERIYFPSRPRTQRAVVRFFGQRLGESWRRRHATCVVSGSRVVVAVVYTRRRRLGVLIDSRGASRCAELTALMEDLLAAGYPDP